jgi:arginine repressor
MVSLGKNVIDVKFIKKILRSLHKRFRVKVTTIGESKDLESMEIEKLVESLQTYEYSLPQLERRRQLPSRHLKRTTKSPLMKILTMKKRMQLLCSLRTSVD